MSFRTSLFLSLRYLKPRWSFMDISTLLSILGPVIGVAALVVVTSVMNGFGDQIRKRFFSLTSHLFVANWGEPIREPEKLIQRLESLGFQATPVVEGPVLTLRQRAGRQLKDRRQMLGSKVVILASYHRKCTDDIAIIVGVGMSQIDDRYAFSAMHLGESRMVEDLYFLLAGRNSVIQRQTHHDKLFEQLRRLLLLRLRAIELQCSLRRGFRPE